MKKLVLPLVLLALLAGGNRLHAAPLEQELADLETKRLAALETAKKDVNTKFRQRYLGLLQKAAAAKDARALTQIRVALANVSTVSPEQYAIEALADKKWTFEVPHAGYRSARIFFRNGTWVGEDGKSEGAWKFDRTGLKIFLSNAPTRPEVFKFPMNAEKWLGIGSKQDVICLSLAPDFQNTTVNAAADESPESVQ